MLKAKLKLSSAGLDTIRAEYAERDQRLEGSDLYSPLNPAEVFIRQQRQRCVVNLLRRHSFNALTDKYILELGCGRGGVLHEFLGYGASPRRLHGTDLLQYRVKDAQVRMPHIPLTCADGQQLPYESAAFDLVLQYTVFSSVLNSDIKANMAREMLRVLRPDGMIIWYDFWLNPTNPNTRGVRSAEIRRLFPGCGYTFRRITLAPPITRRLVHRSWMACYLLESLKLLNTHYLVAIRPDR